MKFNNRVILTGVLVLLLAGCSSLPELSQQATEPAQQTADEPPLSPFELMALELKRQPNQYHQSRKRVSAQARNTFADAIAWRKQGELDKAKQAFEQLTETNRDLSGPWLQLGDLAALQDNDASLKTAVSHYRRAIDINPANYLAHNRLARTLREQGKFSEAEQHYRQALVSWPAYDKAYLNLGILYDLYMGDKQKALEQYQIYQALQDKPQRQIKGWIADLSRQLASEQHSQLASQSTRQLAQHQAVTAGNEP